MDDKGKCPHEVLGSDCRANCDGDCICTGDCGTCAAGCLPTLERCCTNCGATFESVRADDATCKKCLHKARLYESIEDGLSLAGKMIDRCEAYEGEGSAARAVIGKALASLEILRAEMVENSEED